MRTLAVVTILAASLGPTLHADEAESKSCSNRTLRGAYGYTITGTRPTPGGPNAGQIEQHIGVGVRQYDGEGHFTQVDTTKGSLAGAAIDITTSGTYAVNANCTGTAFVFVPGLPAPVEVRFVVVDNGKEIRWVVSTRCR